MPPEEPDSPAKPPGAVTQVWNLAEALSAFVSDGLRLVAPEQYRQRLAICDTCDRRDGNRCLECGCQLLLKARGRAFRCPLDKWPSITE